MRWNAYPNRLPVPLTADRLSDESLQRPSDIQFQGEVPRTEAADFIQLSGCVDGEPTVTVRLLLDAGETFEASILPTGCDDIEAVLREQLRRSSPTSA